MSKCCNCISNMNEKLHSAKYFLNTKEKLNYQQKSAPNIQDSDCNRQEE